jgi:hypothetical protein
MRSDGVGGRQSSSPAQGERGRVEFCRVVEWVIWWKVAKGAVEATGVSKESRDRVKARSSPVQYVRANSSSEVVPW